MVWLHLKWVPVPPMVRSTVAVASGDRNVNIFNEAKAE